MVKPMIFWAYYDKDMRARLAAAFPELGTDMKIGTFKSFLSSCDDENADYSKRLTGMMRVFAFICEEKLGLGNRPSDMSDAEGGRSQETDPSGFIVRDSEEIGEEEAEEEEEGRGRDG